MKTAQNAILSLMIEQIFEDIFNIEDENSLPMSHHRDTAAIAGGGANRYQII